MAKKTKKDIGLGIRALLANMEQHAPQAPEEKQEVVRQLADNVAMIPVDQIEVNPWQPRKEFDEDALEELRASLTVHGLIQPVTVRRLHENAYQLISGERRTRASRLAGLTEIPAYIRIADDQEMLEMALVENIQRQDLNPMEVAFTYQRLIDECNLTHEAMSDRVGKKRSTISNALRLLKLPPEIQHALKTNKLSMGHARALAGIEDLTRQLHIYRKIINDDLSVRATESLIRAYALGATKQDSKDHRLPDAYRSVQEKVGKHFGAKVTLKVNSAGRGQIVIPFGSDKDLNRLLEVLDLIG